MLLLINSTLSKGMSLIPWDNIKKLVSLGIETKKSL